jgi:transcriptional regulator with XRE-family HTH domain
MSTVKPGGGQLFPGLADAPVDAIVLRMLLGTQLRRLREAAGVTPERAGAAIRGSRSKISRMETGRVRFKIGDVTDLLLLYGVTDEQVRSGFVSVARQSGKPGWWAKYGDVLPDWFETYLGLESAATAIRCFDVQFVHGLFQAEDYARAVIRLGHPSGSPGEIEDRVAVRLKRQDLLARQDPPRIWSVMDESVLHRPVGGPGVLRAELRHLVEVCAMPHVTIQVMPSARGGHAGEGGSFAILRFGERDLPDAVYIGQLTSGSSSRPPARHEYPAEKGAAMTSDQLPVQNEPASAAEHRPLPFDMNVAHQARMYDYLLGGKDHYAADRAAADAWLKIDPRAVFGCRANRAFLGRAVRYLAADAGIRQFLDVGTGIPTAGNTHEVAQAIAPESRVVYVDYDPIVLAHARALLTSNRAGATEYIDADLRDTPAILSQARQLLDFTRPVAVTLMAILHAIPDAGDPHAIVARLMEAVPSGSHLAISHIGSDLFDRETLDGVKDITAQMADWDLTPRSREQVASFFEGMDLVEPGLVRVEEWHPGPAAGDAAKSTVWCAVARKR